ncbi:aspartate transaminase [Xanthomonas sp. Kuri4-1]
MSKSLLAARTRRIKPSPSSTTADRANALRRSGRSIVSLVVGEPDFDTPPHIRRAAAAAIEQGQTRYTQNNGTPALREAIAGKLHGENGVACDPAQVLVTTGAKSAIFLALLATLEAGDEVLVPAPYWVSYPDMVLACDGTPVIVPCGEATGFKLTGQALAAAITPRTRWLILNSPSNPTGASYDEDEWRAIAAVLLQHPHVWLMTDEIYEHIQYLERPARHPLVLEPALQDRTLIVNGVSKTYAMTGWRIGYAAGPAPLIDAMAMLQSQSTSNACSVSQAAALAALQGDQGFVADCRAVYRARRDAAMQWIAQIPGLSCTRPDGAFYLFVNCAGLIGLHTDAGVCLEDDEAVVLYLLDRVGVAVVQGSAYGMSPYFRMSVAVSMDTLKEGCERIAVAVAALQRRLDGPAASPASADAPQAPRAAADRG